MNTSGQSFGGQGAHGSGAVVSDGGTCGSRHRHPGACDSFPRPRESERASGGGPTRSCCSRQIAEPPIARWRVTITHTRSLSLFEPSSISSLHLIWMGGRVNRLGLAEMPEMVSVASSVVLTSSPVCVHHTISHRSMHPTFDPDKQRARRECNPAIQCCGCPHTAPRVAHRKRRFFRPPRASDPKS